MQEPYNKRDRIYTPRSHEESIALFGRVPGSSEKELFDVLDLIVAEFESDLMSVQCFDLRTVERAKAIVGTYRRGLKMHKK